jgi:hypothetical protein
MSLTAVTLLAACSAGGHPSVPSAAFEPAAAARTLASPGKKAVRFVYVADFNGASGGGSIDAFPIDANGAVPPTIQLSGSATQIENPEEVATDRAGDVMTLTGSEGENPAIAIFAAGQTGNVAPARLIVDADSSHRLYLLAAAADGTVYALYQEANKNGKRGIDIFAPGTNGTVQPSATIAGSNTLLNPPQTIQKLYVDADGGIWWACDGEVGNAHIVGYPAGSTGNVKPSRVIRLSGRGQTGAFAAGERAVYNSYVKLYAYTQASGNKPAGAYEPDCDPDCYVGAIDGTNALFVSNPFPANPGVVTYHLTSTYGKLTALRTIDGAATTLVTPMALAVSPK